MEKRQYGWIVEVLDDLYQFSIENKLHKITCAIEKAKWEALGEIKEINSTNYDTVMSVVVPKGYH